MQFAAAVETVIEGEGNVLVTAIIAGISGNVGAGSITMIPKTIQGITACTNLEPARGGYAAESDSALRERYYEALRTPATSGNIYHYKQWAKAVSGVGDAKVYPLWAGDNTVQVVIINDNMQPADDTLIKSVQDYIDPESNGTGEGQAPIGAYCTVTSAEALLVNISVKLILQEGYSTVEIDGAVKEYLKEIAFKQNYVSYGRIGNAILDVTGVKDYENLLINDGTANIIVPDKSVAVLGEVVISE